MLKGDHKRSAYLDIKDYRKERARQLARRRANAPRFTSSDIAQKQNTPDTPSRSAALTGSQEPQKKMPEPKQQQSNKLKSARQIVLKYKVPAAAAALIVVAATSAFFLNQDGNFANVFRSSPAQVDEPGPGTALPSGKSVEELGGWKRVSPPEADPVFAYSDTINAVPVSVSQQQLPRSLGGNTANHVAEMAKQFNANTILDAGGTDVYIGTSAKGPQSVIFTKNDVLILIKSQEKIDNPYWIEYIRSLE